MRIRKCPATLLGVLMAVVVFSGVPAWAIPFNFAVAEPPTDTKTSLQLFLTANIGNENVLKALADGTVVIGPFTTTLTNWKITQRRVFKITDNGKAALEFRGGTVQHLVNHFGNPEPGRVLQLPGGKLEIIDEDIGSGISPLPSAPHVEQGVTPRDTDEAVQLTYGYSGSKGSRRQGVGSVFLIAEHRLTSVRPVPEPSTLAMTGLGLVLAACFRRNLSAKPRWRAQR